MKCSVEGARINGIRPYGEYLDCIGFNACESNVMVYGGVDG